MNELAKQFVADFMQHVPKNAFVCDYVNKDFSILVATSILQEEKVAEADTRGYHLLVERFYLKQLEKASACSVLEVGNYYTSEKNIQTLLENIYGTLLYLYGPDIKNPKLVWKFTAEWIDVYLYVS